MDPIANFSGLASGIQWHDMIDQIMKLEAARSVDPLTNRVGTQTARIDAWKTYEGLVSKLKSASLALRDGTSFGIYNATAGTNAAGRALISATASSTASPGSYRVEVIGLARAEKLNGRNEATTTTALNLTGQFFVNGRAVDLAATDTLNDVRDKINAVNSGSNASGVTATILTTGPNAHRLILTADQTGSRGIELVDSASGGGVLQELGILDGTLTANSSRTDSSRTESQRFTSSANNLAAILGVSPQPAETTIKIGDKTVTVDLANDTLIEIYNRLDAAGVPASIVEESVAGRTQYRLSVQGAVTADPDATDPAESQRVVELLGFQKSGRPGEITAGSDAVASIDGFRISRRTNVISDAIAGVSINLLAADTAGRSTSTTGGALAVTVDPQSISAGTYAVSFEATTARDATATGAGLAVISQTGVQNGTIADGSYAVELIETTTRSTSADPNLSVAAAPLSVAAGVYTLETTVTRSQSTNDADLTAVVAGPGVPAGSYAAELTTTRSVSDNHADLEVLTAGSGVAVGNHLIDVTTAATRATATAGTAFSTALVNPSQTISFQNVSTGTSVNVPMLKDETLAAFVTRANGLIGGLGLQAVDNAGRLEIRSTSYGSAGTFKATASHADVATGLGIGSTVGQTYLGVDVQGEIAGVAATGVGQVLTGTGAYSGLSLRHTGATATVGTVSINDVVTGTINGAAATWNAGAGTLTAANGLVLDYTGPVPAGSLTAPTTFALGSVTLTDTVSGEIGNVAANWDAGTQTFTRADGLAVGYTGTFATGTLGSPTVVDLGDVTITDTPEITGGTIGGHAATWDAVTGTLTANSGTALEGLTVAYSGSATGGMVGTVNVGSTTTLDGVTIGGEAADWDAVTGTIRGRAGSRFEGLEMSYSGPASYPGTTPPGYVGDLVISGGVAVDLTVSRNTGATVEAIQAYADAFNSVREFVDKQRTSGDVLASNGTLRGTTRSLTEVMLADVESLAGTGFSRAANAGVALDRDGRLQVDTAALSAALSTSPNDVQALFGEVGRAMYTTTDSIAAAFTGTVASQIRSLEESNAALELRIGDAEARLEVRRQSMLREFTRMETMISQIQSQGNWLSQQIQSLQPSRD